MNKPLVITALFVLLFAITPVFAQNQEAGQNGNAVSPTQTQDRIQYQATDDDETANDDVVTGQNENANQNQTQNQGEDSQLQEQEQENESEQETSGMSVEPLLIQTQTRASVQVMTELMASDSFGGSVGDQVKSLVQTQQQVQGQIQEKQTQVENRSSVLKFLIGPDFLRINTLRQEITQTQERIRELTRLQLQLDNSGDQTLVAETIASLTQEMNTLQTSLDDQENSFSLLGWLFKLFA